MPRAGREGGAATIEFALAFMLAFVVLYGIAGYTVPLLLAASYQQLAADGLRDIILLSSPAAADPDFDPQENFRRLIAESWIPETWAVPCADYPNGFLDLGEEIWRVCLRHADPAGLLPPLRLLGWEVPQLPEEIRGEAILRLR